jgi:programmed cell death 6-interacting protein
MINHLPIYRVLEELRLPYSLDIVDALPKKLVDCAEEVQHEGGIQSLHDMLQKIQTMSQKTLNLIEEGFNALEEENEHDAVMSRQYGKCKFFFSNLCQSSLFFFCSSI